MSTHPSPPQAGAIAIPAGLNLAISAGQLLLLPTLLIVSRSAPWWPWMPVLAVAYALTMNSAYLMMHEAHHALLHPDRRINDGAGVLLGLFFPAPFHLLRQGHLGHHVRNRSDDEAFDYYFPGDNRLWKSWSFYNILWGGFWLLIALSNFILPFMPRLWTPKSSQFDRSTEALIESLNPRYDRLIRVEAAAIIGLHVFLVAVLHVPFLHWLALVGFSGAVWSSMQYMHHYGTERDVHKGARNLRSWRWLDTLWLNHNWHQRHHEHPYVPWVHLPTLEDGPSERREPMLRAWLAQWRGPQSAPSRVLNPHAGRKIS
jgi:fatty acid desaturase